MVIFCPFHILFPFFFFFFLSLWVVKVTKPVVSSVLEMLSADTRMRIRRVSRFSLSWPAFVTMVTVASVHLPSHQVKKLNSSCQEITREFGIMDIILRETFSCLLFFFLSTLIMSWMNNWWVCDPSLISVFTCVYRCAIP